MGVITAIAICVSALAGPATPQTMPENCMWIEFAKKPKENIDECRSHIEELTSTSLFFQTVLDFVMISGETNSELVGVFSYCVPEEHWTEFEFDHYIHPSQTNNDDIDL